MGMARHHCAIRQYTLGEFAREQESSHRNILRQHLRQEKLNARKMKVQTYSLIQMCCGAFYGVYLLHISVWFSFFHESKKKNYKVFEI